MKLNRLQNCYRPASQHALLPNNRKVTIVQLKIMIEKDGVIRNKALKFKPKAFSTAQVRKLKFSLTKNLNATSKTIFNEAGIPNIPKTTRNVYLRKLGTVMKVVASPPLTKLLRGWVLNG